MTHWDYRSENQSTPFPGLLFWRKRSGPLSATSAKNRRSHQWWLILYWNSKTGSLRGRKELILFGGRSHPNPKHQIPSVKRTNCLQRETWQQAGKWNRCKNQGQKEKAVACTQRSSSGDRKVTERQGLEHVHAPFIMQLIDLNDF